MKSSRVMLVLKVVVVLCMLAVLIFCWNADPWNLDVDPFVWNVGTALLVVILASLCLGREDAGQPPYKPKPTNNEEPDYEDTI